MEQINQMCEVQFVQLQFVLRQLHSDFVVMFSSRLGAHEWESLRPNKDATLTLK